MKKYKKARKAVHYSAVGLGAVAAAFFSGAIAASLTGVGVVVGAPVAGLAASTGFVSTSLTVLNKKLDRKVDKHSLLLSLATAKHDSINCCVSQTLNDNNVSDKEFQLVTREMEKYRQLKETLRSKFVNKPAASPPQFDMKKIRQQVRQELTKKLVESTSILSEKTHHSLKAASKQTIKPFCGFGIPPWISDRLSILSIRPPQIEATGLLPMISIILMTFSNDAISRPSSTKSFERGQNRYGEPCVILKLEHISGPIIFVWAPGRLVLPLQQEKDAKFVQNLGVKVDANRNQYFDFKLC